MVSLDAREYLLRLEEELEDDLPKGERKLAVREVRHLLRDMAFDLAARKRRPQPEDLDYAIALEALKPPEAAAEVLRSRRDRYRGKRRRKRLRRLVMLVLVVIVGMAAVAFTTSQVAEPLFEGTFAFQEPTSEVVTRNLTVEEGFTRLDVEVRAFVQNGSVRVTLLDPAGRAAVQETFGPEEGPWFRTNVEDPAPGRWTLFVDYLDARGSVRVEVLGVRAS